MYLKRAMSLALACSLAFTPISSFAANETMSTPPATQAVQNADTLKALNLISGDANGLRLDDQLSRAEALVLIVKLLGEQDQLANVNLTTYKDVKSTDWFAPYIAYAKQNGIASGISKDQFAPNAPVNEKQFLKMLLSAMHYEIGKDFTWEGVESFAASKGYAVTAVSDKDKTNTTATFDRSDAFNFTFTALKQAPKDETATVLEKLVTSGKIDQKLLEQPVVAKTIDKKLIETIQANVAPKATSTTAPTTVATTQPVQTPTNVSPAPSGGFSGGSSGGGSFSGGGSSGGSTPAPNPTPNPNPIPAPVLPAKEVNLLGVQAHESYIDLLFSEELDAKTAETIGVVTITSKSVYSTAKKLKYFVGEKKLRAYLEGIMGSNITCKATVNPALLKTSTGNPVQMNNTVGYFNSYATLFGHINNTETQLNIGFAAELKNLNDISQIQVINETAHTTLPIKHFEQDPTKLKVTLTATEIPKDAILKIVFNNILLDYKEEHHTNYEITYRTTKRAAPKIEKTDFDSPEKLLVYFNESIQENDLTTIGNYKLYRNAVAKDSEVSIESVKISNYGSTCAELQVKNLVTTENYILVISNMTSIENVDSEGPLQHSFSGPICYSTVRIDQARLTLDNEVYIRYSSAVDQTTALDVSNYEVSPTTNSRLPNGDVIIKPTKVTYDTINDIYLLTFKDTSFMTGERVMLHPDLTHIKDATGKPLKKNADTYYDLEKEKVNEPIRLSFAYMTSASSITIDSNYELDINSITALENYSIKDDNNKPVKIHKASLGEYNSRLVLEVDPVFNNKTKYNLIINGLKSLTKQTLPTPATVEFTGRSTDQTPPVITYSEHVTSESAIYLYVSEPLLDDSEIRNVTNYKVEGFTMEACAKNDYSNPVALNDLIKSATYVPEKNAIKWIIDSSKLKNKRVIKCSTTNIKDLHNNEMYTSVFSVMNAPE